MRVLVTGRDGQLAQSLAERAAEKTGIELLFAARPDFDLERPDTITATIDLLRPDVVINAAAYTDVDGAEDDSDRAFRINAEAVGEIAEASAKVGAAIIQFSTDYVFDGRSSTPYREGDPTGPLNVYGASKLAGEEQVRAANDRHLILRTSWLVGPFGHNFVKTVLRLAGERHEIRVVADQFGSPTSTLMLADAILAVLARWREPGCAQAGLGQTFHLAGEGACSWAQLAEEVMRVSADMGGNGAGIVPIPSSDYPTRARRPACSVLDSSRFKQTFSFEAQPWQPMIAELVGRLLRDGNGH